jgi:hypothetical protein
MNSENRWKDLVMRKLTVFLQPLAVLGAALPIYGLLVGSAEAHVKWFCAFDVAGQPRGLENVLCPDFEYLIGLSVIALLAGALFEGTHIGLAMQRSMDRVTAPILDRTELMFRAGTAFFFIAVWGFGGVLLTPELKTDSTLIGAIQVGIAAGMLSRRTMPLSALGIAVLYAVALYNYGLFHLLDYPVFLGVAAYLALTGLQRDFFGIKAIDIVRWTAGITLMWASIEKWAYPEWTYPLLTQHPGMTLGFDTDFYMRSAGAVEFALAFALVWTPLVRRVAAIMLTPMFIGAVVTFGKVDMIGHTLIVVVLFAIAADNRGSRELVRYPYLMPVGYAAALALFMAAYYGGHSALFGTTVL